MSRAAWLMAAGLLLSCEGTLSSRTPDAACPPQGRNDEIRLALAPACASCHTTGNKPYFANLASFENGIVYDTKWVVDGDPDHSGLVKLLEGTAGGTYPQMPPGETYDGVLARRRVTLTIKEIKAWIKDLPERPAVDDGPSPAAFTVRRLRAEEMVVSLMDQLGLTVEDFLYTGDPNWRDQEWNPIGGKLFVWPSDWAPGISGQYISDKRTIERYETLGGAVVLQGRKKDVGLGPSSMLTLVQMSQAWCQRAIEKPGNTAVLRYVTLNDTSAAKSAEIRRNIASLSLRMLGDVPSDDDVNELYQQVYLPLEPSSTKTAWTAVCAALVRHPKWLSY